FGAGRPRGAAGLRAVGARRLERQRHAARERARRAARGARAPAGHRGDGHPGRGHAPGSARARRGRRAAAGRPMKGYRALLEKEIVELWRSYRLAITCGLFVVLGIGVTVLERYLPAITRLFGQVDAELRIGKTGVPALNQAR